MASTKMNNSMAAGQQRSGTQPRFAAAAMAVMAAILLAAQLLLRLNGGHQVGQGYGGTSAGIAVLSGVAFVGLAGLGAFIASRRPDNPIGWLLGTGGLIFLLDNLMKLYAGSADILALPGRDLVLALENHIWIPAIGLVAIFVGLLFPTGNLLSRRWRWVAWVAAFTLTLAYVAGTMDTDPRDFNVPGAVNPLRPQGILFTAVDVVSGVLLLLPLLAMLAVISLVLRYRRGQTEERHQIRIVMYAMALYAVTFGASRLAGQVTSGSVVWLQDVSIIGILAVPFGAGVAVLKYRLYDIDVVISRTLVYGSLAAFITAVYVGIAVGIGTLVGSGGKPNLGLSILATAIVAVGFQPLREHMQRFANRLVYGKRATPYEVLAQFSERVAESYASDEVLPRMARVLAEGTGADLAEVWLRSGDVLRPAAAFPLESPVAAPVQLHGAGPPTIPDAARAVEVRQQGELLGALTVTKRRGESLTPIEIKLMDDLAHQAGLVLKNVGLTADLQARLGDLRASRQRLVAAQDNERRRLERNLHDGAQQHLVAIKVKLGLVEMLATRDPEKAKATIVALKHDADEALETLRDLARGIYPPLLAQKGLAAALTSQAGKATLPVHVDADGVGRYPQETEAALYFCTLEALQNVQKYAVASAATVRLRADEKQLLVEVTDDGRGFDVTAVTRGAGLTNMEDRLDALGGTLQIQSTPGVGTTLRASVPISHAVPVTSVSDARLAVPAAPGGV
jgi:signal transduction histidine kinase